MLRSRVIPCLLLRGEGLVKTVGFKAPKYVGDPINTIKIFNEKEVDEVMLADIEASKQGREPNYRKIEEVASECFMPLCYGGGIRDISHADRLFASGVEKISLQTGAFGSLDLVEKIATKYGSSSVVVSADLKKSWMGGYRLYSAAGHRKLPKRWQAFLKDAVSAGAGEIFLNAVDRDGTMAGMDCAMIREAAALVSVPLIACGGVGSLDDIKAGVDAGASAVGAGAFFVYQGPHRAVLISYPKYQQLVALLGSDSA
ncbi:MAG: imidazole glycerol phosphate synthase subunit HisF [Alphaproteobacteria bacterium]|nr:imidazole glycerol phosphate synthase subunit HisF [Alphaproteobacteria bacterium]